MTSNYALYPKEWIQEYVETVKGFDIFLKHKAREARLTQAQSAAVVKVVNWNLYGTDGASVYYAARDDLLSIYSLFEEVDTITTDITQAAAAKLGVSSNKMTKVALYHGPDSKSNNDLREAFFVCSSNLAYCHGNQQYNIIRTIQLRNIPVVKYLLETATKDWSTYTDSGRKSLIDSVVSMDNPEIYQQLSDLTGWFHDADNMLLVLEEAAMHNSFSILKYLTEVCPDQVRTAANRVRDHNIPINLAIVNGSREAAEIILQYTSRDTVLIRDQNGRTVLDEAVINRRECMVEILVSSQWCSNLIACTDDKGFTSLHRAAYGSNYPIFRLLYDAHAKAGKLLVSSNAHGTTAFLSMVKVRNTYLIRLFMDDIGTTSPLTIAADNYNQTAMHWAAYHGFYEIVDVLYSAFAQKNALLVKPIHNGYTFFMWLIRTKYGSIIKQLVERPDFDPRLVSETDCFNQTTMMAAIHGGLTETCELIYEHVLATNTLLTRSYCGYNALIYTAAYDLAPVTNLLTNDPNLCDQQMTGDENGYTALHHAVRCSPEACKLIYERCLIDKVCIQTEKHKLTALHIAVLYRCTDMVQILLSDPIKARALVWIPDSDGCTALDYARMWSGEMVKIIFDAGVLEYMQPILPHINEMSLQILLVPGSPRSELILFKYSRAAKLRCTNHRGLDGESSCELPIDILTDRTKHICSIDEESISSRIDDLDRM